jgi:hypothetical protein
MPALGVMGVTTPAERLTRGGVGALFTLGAAPSRPQAFRCAGGSSANRLPPAPINNGRFGTVPGSHLRRIGLDLTAAILHHTK